MRTTLCFGLAFAALTLTSVAGAPPAAADTWVAVGGGGYWRSEPYPYHRHYYSGWDRPVYVMPPPAVVYAPPPVVYAPPPAVVYAPPPPAPAYEAPASGMVNAAPTSPAYVDARGRSCREYQTSVVVGGASRPAYGTACQQPDGSWRVVQ